MLKRSTWLLLLACVAADRMAAAQTTSMPARPATLDGGAGLPAITIERLAILVNTARVAMEDAMKSAPERGAAYRPRALAGVSAIIHLTARSRGTVVAEAESSDMNVVDAAAAAGTLLGRAIRDRNQARTRPAEDPAALGLEFEWIGPPEYLSAKFADQHTWSDELLHAFDGGLEGVGVELQGKRGRTRPGAILAANYSPDLALTAAERSIDLKHDDKVKHDADIRYFRFRTYHVWSPGDAGAALPTLLVRGESLIEMPIGREQLDAAIRRLGSYLLYRQNRDGWFSYEFVPTTDRYVDANAATAQMQACAALARYARWSRDDETMKAATRTIDAVLPHLQAMTRASEASTTTAPVASSAPATIAGGPLVVDFQGHGQKLETSALFLIALQSLEDPRYHRQAAGLLQGLLDAQDPLGRIEMLFTAATDKAAEEFEGAGWALMALGRAEDSARAPAIERALHRSLLYYRPVLLPPATTQAAMMGPGPLASTVLARGFAAGYRRNGEAAFSDLVFSVLDRVTRLQLVDENCARPELRGAISAETAGDVGADTAYYLSALADGVELAERVGDRDRRIAYRTAVERAARFVMQLQVSEAGTFYMRSPKDAIGGIRMRPWDNRIRIDYCAESLLGLIRAREVLHGKG